MSVKEVNLRSLDGSNPLGFLAALGVLVELELAGLAPRLRWTDDVVSTAMVMGVDHTDEIVDIVLRGRQRWLKRSVLAWPALSPLTDVKSSPGELRDWALAVERDSELDRSPGDLWCALVAEGALDGGGKTKPTHLHFTAGQQRFLAMVVEIAGSLDEGHLQEAMVGPWRYGSSLPSLGWDSRGERIYAVRATDPSKEQRRGVPGADWLAFVGLSCYPVMNDRGHLRTTACAPEWKRSSFRWPIWSVPLGLPTIRSLLARPDLVSGSSLASPRQLSRLGIVRVLEAGVRRTDQGGYGSFGAAETIVEADPIG